MGRRDGADLSMFGRNKCIFCERACDSGDTFVVVVDSFIPLVEDRCESVSVIAGPTVGAINVTRAHVPIYVVGSCLSGEGDE